jgi:transposase InsO family protein
MVVHKRARLLPYQRKELAREYFVDKVKKKDLIVKYGVTYPTVQKILARAKQDDYSIHTSSNKRYRCLEYGLKRLGKIERAIQDKLARQARRYEKDYPGEMLHFDTKRLPLLTGETRLDGHEYLFVAIDDHSRELYAGIYSDKSMFSSADFLNVVLAQCPYSIERILTDNGTEYKGRYSEHAFMKTCGEAGITQKFTKVRCPQTNGKAERVIRTLMEGWHNKDSELFTSRERRAQALARYVNYYNCIKPHKGIDGATPLERLCEYFYQYERPTKASSGNHKS